LARIFVSYSARVGDAADHLVNDLFARLSEQHKVFVDRWSLAPGDKWRSVIYHKLAECDAAVVLLGASALGSRWVQREVDILLWRRALGANVVLVPVLLDDVRAEELRRAGLDELLDLQAAHVLEGDDEFPAAMIADRVVRLLPSSPVDDPMTEWATRISDCLSGLEERHLLASMGALGLVADESIRRHGSTRSTERSSSALPVSGTRPGRTAHRRWSS
jgi:hypothetical protein